ncbi:MAG: hypothetical protein M9949_02745 [Candidatus Kapabacteria bacterium]|nr:hypothetical protein [Candidatus Kapabacteria bacterium]
MKKYLISFLLLLLLASCGEESTKPSDCSLYKLNMFNHPDTIAIDSYMGSIPDCIGDLTNLKVLGLYNNGIKVIPEAFFKLKNLDYFISLENAYEFIPDKFDRLVSLRYLHIYNANMSKIPPSLFTLTSLISLSFADSPIDSIPDEIGNMINLEDLNFNDTKISKLPSTIQNLKGTLRKLEIIDTNVPQSEIDSLIKWLPNTEISYSP